MDPPVNPTLQEPGVRPPEPKSSPQPVTQPPVTPLPAPATVASSVDIERFSKNIARMVEEGGRALAAYMKPREEGRIKDERAEEITDMVKTLGHVMEYWLSDPQRTFDLQSRLARSYLELWASTVKRMAGEPAAPVAKPDPRDKRFADPEWSSNQFFDFLKQAYLLSTDWANKLVADAGGLDPRERHKAEFYMRQIANAIAPSNFVLYQNELMQLIQYAPTTEKVLKIPLLIVPPWINKFYILDLTPDKSFIKWCVDQGVTVFCVSWVNPDEHLAERGFADYMQKGPLQALDVVEEITGEPAPHTIGYCVGGTLLAITLAYLAAKGRERVKSMTLFTAQVDFTYAGDLKVFAADEAQIAMVERQMAERGYLEGKKMANAFNLLRSNDLIWPYVINNYLRGREPMPFDLLYWNSDATRMPKANHSFYLRECYLENDLAKGAMELAGQQIDLKKVNVPIYNLATREDHIAPARSVYFGSSFFRGPVRFVLAGSGHIAGVVNPPYKQKYQHWTGGPPHGDDLESWLNGAQEHPGSWWPYWLAWLKALDAEEVAARAPGGDKYPPIEDAPGSYVKVRGD
jgi:polyhydroxyalkanoate synthase